MREQTTEEIIASAMRLPPNEQEKIANTLFENAISAAYGSSESQEAVDAAWRDEIASRVAGIETRQVETVPADKAERMIRNGD